MTTVPAPTNTEPPLTYEQLLAENTALKAKLGAALVAADTSWKTDHAVVDGVWYPVLKVLEIPLPTLGVAAQTVLVIKRGE